MPAPLRHLWLLAALCAALCVPAAKAAPGFALSGLADELAGTVVADDGGGPLTVLDVLLYWDMMRRPQPSFDTAEWLKPAEERDPAAAALMHQMCVEALAARGLAKGAGAVTATDPAVERTRLHSAAECVWIERTVEPQITIGETDINRYYLANASKYSTPERARVRYIFLPIEDPNKTDTQREALDKLGKIRDRIIQGELSFAEAARQFSGAPSASLGGLVPDFTRGSFFPEFDYHTFVSGKPGQMTEPFIGREGAYLIQVISTEPARRQPLDEVRDEIKTTLGSQHIAAYYRFLQRKLADQGFTRDLAGLWPYADFNSPVAIAAGRKLTRDSLLRLNPTVINADYQVQFGVVQAESAGWIEGETILQDLAAKGLMTDPILERARAVAATVEGAKAALAAHVSRGKYATREAALTTLGMEPGGAAPGIPQTRVVRLTITPNPKALMALGRDEMARQTVRGLVTEVAAGSLPTRPDKAQFVDKLGEAAAGGEDPLGEEIDRINGLISASPFVDVDVKFEDIGWKDSLPILAWHPSLIGLNQGQLSPPQRVGENVIFYYAATTRLDTKSPWLERPLILQSLAHDIEEKTQLEAAMVEIENKGAVKF